ncbi:hypothetical protein [Brevundimonas fluminis]|jgi:hypothetical protein|uniref:hypothetical protein n=1 Tax=Brevundimonas fluminis TaxID=2487274 RepID=UPI0013DE4082|nr:hypothetical protein [Brevundimonas fluminis]
MRLTDQELAARKRRNLWIAGGLIAFMILVFLTTFLRMQRNMEEARAARAGVAAEAAR